MLVSKSAEIPEVVATWITRLKRNSSPRANMRRITPSSESVRTIPSSAERGIGVCGPTIMPAMR